MERGEEEDERERIGRRHQEPDHPEREQRAAVPREAFLRTDRPPRQEPGAGDDPAGPGEQDEGDERRSRPGDVVQRRCASVAAPPEVERSEDEEEPADPGPEAESAAVAAKRGRDVDPPPAAAGEEVDRGSEKRQQHGDENDLDRPAADEPLSEEDVARGPLRKRHTLLHRIQRVLRREADQAEMPDVQSPGYSTPRLGRSRAGRCHGDRGDPPTHERRLLVRVERECEPEELL